MVSCILLCAGYSSRFGSPKALASMDGLRLIERIQNILTASNLDEIIVVLGANFEEIKPYVLKHKKIKVVYNKDYNLGQTSSFKAGLKAVSAASQGIMLLPIDFPLIQTATINLLLDVFNRTNSRPFILVPTHQNKKGHPPVFDCSLIKELFALKDSEGINTILHRHADTIELCPVTDQGTVLTFNTPGELTEILSRVKIG